MTHVSHENELADLRNEMTQAETLHLNEIQTIHAVMEELNEYMHDQSEQILDLEAYADFLLRIISVYEAQTLFIDEDLEAAINILDEILLAVLPPDIQLIANRIIAYSYPILGSDLYTRGLQAFNESDYLLALATLTEAHRFLMPRHPEDLHPPQWSQLLFMLGRIHYLREQYDESQAFLIELRERVPNLQENLVTEMLENIEALLHVDDEDD